MPISSIDWFLELSTMASYSLPTTNTRGNSINDVGARYEEFVRQGYVALNGNSNPFSYIDHSNNPPDFMVANGEAIEVKKFKAGTSVSSFALNSSFPKDILHSSNPLLTSECKNCEQWSQKPHVYQLAKCSATSIEDMFICYGTCLAAHESSYIGLFQAVRSGVRTIPGNSPGNELGRFKKIDPLDRTVLRVRGMWELDSPWKAFGPLLSTKPAQCSKSFRILSLKADFETLYPSNALPNGVSRKDVSILDPNNGAKELDAVLLEFFK
jgi:hypothetical protein